ncbi:MAG: glycosyltransferase family 2 protein [Planctomycetota bacterium]|nr:glycosyltransferase family 2 protein [Planctomycetota bacterium]
MAFFVTACIVLALASLPLAMFLKNLQDFQRACSDPSLLEQASSLPVSVLIPARNEESSINAALDRLIESTHRHFEVLVLDDASEDATAAIVESKSERFPSIQLHRSQGLAPGWNGKQNACWQLAQLAQYDRLLFLDADVRLSSEALTRILAEQEYRQAPLISGFPFQETGTFAEKLLIPMMHYILLGFLPIDRMRNSTDPGFAAGCGQLFLAKKSEYMQAGGHRAIAQSRHDGIKLPRAFRLAGLKTDLFDASDLATCRMYQNMHQVHQGLLKNATEGIANPKLIVPFTILLLGGSVLPICLFLWQLVRCVDGSLRIGLPSSGLPLATLIVLGIATLLGWAPRLLAQKRFGQSMLGALLHPWSVLWFVILQWTALVRQVLRLKTAWRGRL